MKVYEPVQSGTKLPCWSFTVLSFVLYGFAFLILCALTSDITSSLDDPGGFFDHYSPPVSAPPPEADCNKHNNGCPDKFNFDRLGMRLAALLVSPLVPRGTVIQDPVVSPADEKPGLVHRRS